MGQNVPARRSHMGRFVSDKMGLPPHEKRLAGGYSRNRRSVLTRLMSSCSRRLHPMLAHSTNQTIVPQAIAPATSHGVTAWLKRHPLVGYFTLAYAGTWLTLAPVVL